MLAVTAAIQLYRWYRAKRKLFASPADAYRYEQWIDQRQRDGLLLTNLFQEVDEARTRPWL